MGQVNGRVPFSILRMLRPAARRIHYTFDLKTAGCESHFRHNWDNKHVVSCC